MGNAEYMGSPSRQALAMPKTIKTESSIDIPENVTVEVKARTVKVTGPRGTLSRSFKHLQIQLQVQKDEIVATYWFGGRREIAKVRTVLSHIGNLFKGVTRGFEYKMRFVYAHFPVNVTIVKGGAEVEIRNFLGEKVVRVVTMREGVKIVRSESTKDEVVLTGNDIDAVSQSAADIQQKCLVKNKDIRKFLDGIYVSQSGMPPAAV